MWGGVVLGGGNEVGGSRTPRSPGILHCLPGAPKNIGPEIKMPLYLHIYKCIFQEFFFYTSVILLLLLNSVGHYNNVFILFTYLLLIFFY